MKISSKGRYALRMMIDIAQHGQGARVTIKDISSRQDISVKYLEQIVTSLTHADLLVSSRGAQGGYMLSKSADQYTVGEIVRAIEGSLAPVSCLITSENTCERRAECTTLKFWEGLNRVVNEYFDSVTLADLVASASDASSDFSI